MERTREHNQVEKALHTLIDGEQALHVLYQLYAAQLTTEADFWQQLAREETYHVRWLESLQPKVLAGLVHFRENRLQLPVFSDFLGYVHQRIAEARVTPPTLFSALSVAVDLEGTVVEKCFFEVFISTDTETRRVLRTLTLATEIHRTRVQEHWTRHKPQGYRPFWT